MTQKINHNQILHTFGPFELTVTTRPLGGRKIEVRESMTLIKEQIQDMKQKSEQQCGDLHLKNGLYVFAIKTPGRNGPIKPFYVGKTDRQGLLAEAFKDHKEVHYNNAIGKCKGKPVLYFLAPLGNKTKLSKLLLRGWERILIYLAYSQNAEICNTQHVPRAMRIEGLRILSHQLGTHARGQSKTKSATELNKLFGL